MVSRTTQLPGEKEHQHLADMRLVQVPRRSIPANVRPLAVTQASINTILQDALTAFERDNGSNPDLRQWIVANRTQIYHHFVSLERAFNSGSKNLERLVLENSDDQRVFGNGNIASEFAGALRTALRNRGLQFSVAIMDWTANNYTRLVTFGSADTNPFYSMPAPNWPSEREFLGRQMIVFVRVGQPQTPREVTFTESTINQ